MSGRGVTGANSKRTVMTTLANSRGKVKYGDRNTVDLEKQRLLVILLLTSTLFEGGHTGTVGVWLGCERSELDEYSNDSPCELEGEREISVIETLWTS